MIDFINESTEKLLDSVGWAILCELQNDARMPYAEIGRRVGLSAPAVMERVRRLEEAGIITGYHAHVDVTRLGRPLVAVLRLRFPHGDYGDVREIAIACPEVLSCDHVTGDDCFLIKVAVASTQALENLIAKFGRYGQTTTSLVLSSPVRHKVIDRVEDSL